MSVRKLNAAETEALLTELSERDCGQGCKCVFCRVFENGRRSVLEDAQITFKREMDELLRRLKA